MALWEAARPVERRMAVLPISMTCPLKVLLGMASMVMSAAWPSFTLTMSVSSTFTSAVISDMSAMVMMSDAGRVLDAENHGFADAHGQVGDHAVEGRRDQSARQYVRRSDQVGLGQRDPALGSRQLGGGLFPQRLGLGEASPGFAESGLAGIELGAPPIEFLAGDQLILNELLGPGVVHFGLLQIGSGSINGRLRALQVFLGGVERGLRSRRVGFGGTQRGSLRRDLSFRLHGLQPSEQLALPHPIAFFYKDFHDPGGLHCVRADVDVVLGLDLSGRGNEGREILAGHAAGLDGNDSALAIL